MSGPPEFSARLLQHSDAQSDTARARIRIAKKRIQAVLDTQGVSHQRTLEQKIAEQGPTNQRVDPHLIGLAILDLLELNRLRSHKHPASGNKPWYANTLTPADVVKERLDTLAPLYESVSGHGFGNLLGDALELVVYKCLDQISAQKPRHAYMGQFHLAEPKDAHNRYRKTQPPRHLGSHSTVKEADFLQMGYDSGTLCIECKNYREWLYPHEAGIRDLIIKASELNAIPVLIARRLHYTTRRNLLEPAGIIGHEAYFQYYPADKAELANQVRDKNSLGFTDVLATEEPHARTIRFFNELLPPLVEPMSKLWLKNRDALVSFARGDMPLAELYTAIDSPAGGKWKDFDAEEIEF